MSLNKKCIPYTGIFCGLFVFLLITVVVSTALGRYPIGVKQTFGIITSRLFPLEPFWSATQESLLLMHRLPRVLLACLVGCALSAAGASYQGVFQNPMAAPNVLGASSGAAFGAALAILLGCHSFLIVLFAFTASLVTVSVVICIGNRTKGKHTLGLILAGIMAGFLVSAGTSFIKLIADPQEQLPAITYWLMGSLNGTTPEKIGFVIVPMICGFIPLLLLRWRINVLTLGDDQAKTMGVNVKHLRTAVILSATLITAASVSVSGMIGWVGLVIPHSSRKLVGSNYRRLLPVSMLLGAIFLLIIDDISRLLFISEIPIGILTSFLGAPFFLYLLSRDDNWS